MCKCVFIRQLCVIDNIFCDILAVKFKMEQSKKLPGCNDTVVYQCDIKYKKHQSTIIWEQQFDGFCGLHSINFLLVNSFGINSIKREQLENFAFKLS